MSLGSRSLSHSVPLLLVHVVNESPPKPWTATMLENHYNLSHGKKGADQLTPDLEPLQARRGRGDRESSPVTV
jgi:hypothetical protein